MPKKSLKIGLVFDDTLDSSDGVAQYVKNLGSWLSAQGHQVSYLVGQTKTTNWAGGKVYSMARNQKVTFNGNKLSIPWPASKKNIKQVIKAGQFDVLHVQMPHSPFMAGRIISQANAQTAIVGTFHVFPSGWLAKIGGKALGLTYWRSKAKFSQVVAVSSAAAQYASQSFGLNTSVIPNLVDSAKFKTTKASSDAPQIVFLGRLVDRKGCSLLIEAFSLLSTTLPDVRLVIAGDGPQRQKLEALVAKRQLTNSVKFLGFIDEGTKASLLAGADIACFPSLYGESFGIVLIEAMAAGSKVVLGGDNPGYRSVLGEQPDLLIDPKNTYDFAARLKKFLSDQQLITRIYEWQTKSVKKYDVNTVGNQIVEVYSEAIAKKTKKSHN